MASETELSKAAIIEYRGVRFRAYDVALGIFLKHLIDIAQERVAESKADWLIEAVSVWQGDAIIGYGMYLSESWSEEQTRDFVELADRACNALAARDSISAAEVMGWDVGGCRLETRGQSSFETGPLVELGRAIIDLVGGTLSPPPGTGAEWYFGVPGGRIVWGEWRATNGTHF